MKLHSPQFERSLRRGVKTAIKKSPALKREYRAAKKFRRHYNSYVIGRALLWVMVGAFTLAIATGTDHPAAALGALSLWIFIFALLHAEGLRSRLFGSTDLKALAMLPVTEDTIFRWQLQKFIRRSAFSLGDAVAGLVTIGWAEQFSTGGYGGAILVSILAWLVSIALGALCAARLHPKRYAWAAKFLFPIIVILFFVLRATPKELVYAFLDRAAPFLNYLLPTGWAISLFQLLLPHPDWLLLIFLVPVFAIIWTLPSSLARLRSFYAFREVERPEAYDLEPGPAKATPLAAAPLAAGQPPFPNATRRRGPTEIVEIIQSRRFLEAPRWPQRGWFENLLWQWLTPRERALSEFAFPNGLSILKAWKKIFFVLTITAAVGFGLDRTHADTRNLIIILGTAFIGIAILSANNLSGGPFRLMINNGVRIPVYVHYPVTLPELARLLLKVSAVQIPLTLPCAAVGGVILSHLAGVSLLVGIQAGLRAGCVLFVSRFIFLIFSFSSGSNDTQNLGLRNLLLLLCMAPLGFLFLLLGGCSILLPEQGIAWAMTAAAAVDAWGFFRVYAWFYNRSFFDLMNLPRR